jgi:predicted outer membrane repeat protein
MSGRVGALFSQGGIRLKLSAARRTGALVALGGLAATLGIASGASAATINVTKTGDPAPNGCTKRDCSLREAVIEANTGAAGDTIKLGAKTYRLQIEGDSEDAAATGDLDVTADLKIVGRGASTAAVAGAWPSNPDSLLEVLGAGTQLTASGLTLRDGDRGGDNGSAILVGAEVRLRLTNSRVMSNDSYGAITNNGTSVVKRVVFRKNDAPCCPAFYNQSAGVAKLTNVTFDRNHADDDTGAMYSDGDEATLKNVTFSDNRAGDCCGGALIIASGANNLTNVTFSGNGDTGEGGAIYAQGGTANLNNVTITDNVADSDEDAGSLDDGGGIAVSGSTVNIQNTLIGGNADLSGEAPDCSVTGGSLVSLGHNLIGDTTGCTFTPAGSDLTDLGGLKLAPLASNGGFTETVALAKGSPAINKGSGKKPGTGGSACAKRDQRDLRRPQGPRCDIGAYERKR